MNLIKYIYRKLLKNRLTSIINIVGLSIAFGVAFSLFLYVDHELSIDSFHSNKARLVRVVSVKDGEVWTEPKLGESLIGKFAGIENFVRTRDNDACVISYKGQNHLVNGNMAMDSSIFSVFDFQLI
jgi:putative ABC transport system permease protein